MIEVYQSIPWGEVSRQYGLAAPHPHSVDEIDAEFGNGARQFARSVARMPIDYGLAKALGALDGVIAHRRATAPGRTTETQLTAADWGQLAEICGDVLPGDELGLVEEIGTETGVAGAQHFANRVAAVIHNTGRSIERGPYISATVGGVVASALLPH